MHTMYALMSTWLTTTRADDSLDVANGGQGGGEPKWSMHDMYMCYDCLPTHLNTCTDFEQ